MQHLQFFAPFLRSSLSLSLSSAPLASVLVFATTNDFIDSNAKKEQLQRLNSTTVDHRVIALKGTSTPFEQKHAHDELDANKAVHCHHLALADTTTSIDEDGDTILSTTL